MLIESGITVHERRNVFYPLKELIIQAASRLRHAHSIQISPGWPAVLLLIAALFFTLPARAELQWHPSPYVPGQGLSFPGLGLNLGGYLNLKYSDLRDQQDSLALQDISLFIHKDIGTRWTLFTEMEFGEIVDITQDGIDSSEAEFDIERLYADYRASQRVTLRLGKFLTPIGRWNLIHADPLVWTVSRPLTSAAAFSRHASGAMVYGTLPLWRRDLDYSIYVDDTKRFDQRESKELAFEDTGSTITLSGAFRRAAGARLLYHPVPGQLELGLSYARFELQEYRKDKTLIGADLHWKLPALEVSAETLRRYSSGSSDADEYGSYVQLVVPLPRHWHAIGRYERYRAAIEPSAATLRTFGLTWRPQPAISWKLEYRSGTGNERVSPSGLLGSLAILF